MIKNCITVLRETPDKSIGFVFVDTTYAPDFYNDPKWDEERRELDRIRRIK